MPKTTFVDHSTVIAAAFLNEVNSSVFDAIGNGTDAPTTSAEVKTNLSLNNVNNTADLDKPISTATQTALPTYPQGQIITASDLTAVSTIADAVYNNRNTVGVAQLSLSNSNSYANNSTWSSVHSHSVRLDWGSNAQFRGWANLAGYITINLGILGGQAAIQNAENYANMGVASGMAGQSLGLSAAAKAQA